VPDSEIPELISQIRAEGANYIRTPVLPGDWPLPSYDSVEKARAAKHDSDDCTS